MLLSINILNKKALKYLAWAVLALSGLCFSALSSAQVALEELQFNELTEGRFEIEMLFNDRPPEPEFFEVANPARLALDFADVESQLDQRRFPLQFEAAESVMVLESQGRTRMVVNLTEPTVYSSRIQGNRMFLVIGESNDSSVSSAAQVNNQGTVARSNSSASGDITNVDFRRGADESSQIIIDLASANMVANLTRRGGDLILEFSNAELSRDMQVRLDVTDYGASVKYIDVYSENDSVMVVADVEGDFEYIAYQGDQQYIINVTPVMTLAGSSNSGSGTEFVGGLISLNYPSIPIRDALKLLADFNGFDLVAGDSVAGNTTLSLTNAPWDQALELVLRSGGLGSRMEGNVMYVAPAEELIASEVRALENVQQAETLSPLRIEYIKINYAVASEVQAFLNGTGEGGGILSERGTVSVDSRTNTLIIQDVDSVLSDVRDMLEILDVPARQVLIEARIVNAETSFSKDLGVRWSGAQASFRSEDNFVLGGNIGAVTDAAIAGALAAPELLVDLGTDSATSSIALGYAGSKGMLALELSALEDSGNGEVIAQPKVTAQDQELARIESGIQIPYQAQAGGTAGGSITQFVDAVLSLEVTPQITPDGRIIMLLDIHQDSVIPNTSGGVPAISTNSVTTRVLVDDGDTIVLGGVFREETRSAVSKTLFLGDLPYIGDLFKQTLSFDTRTELLIFITPSIIKEFQ